MRKVIRRGEILLNPHAEQIAQLVEKVEELAELVSRHERRLRQLEGRIDRAEAGLEWSQHLEEVGDEV